MKIKNLLLLLFLASLWGPSFMLIKVALTELPPLTLAALRIGSAAIALNLFLWIRGGKVMRDLTFWKQVTVAGFFAQGLPFVLINWGELHIDSALASILNGLTPMFTMVMAHFFIATDRMTLPKALGIGMGFIGLLVLISPNFSWDMPASTWGILSVSIGAASYAVGAVYSRLKLMGAPTYYAPAGQLLTATVYLIPLSLWIDRPYQLSGLSWSVIGAVATLGLLGTALAFVIYYKILAKAGPSYLSLVTYIVPIFGVILGVTVLEESLSIEVLVGAFLILLGLGIAHRKPRPKREKEPLSTKAASETCPKKATEKQPIVQVYIR